MLEEGGSFVGNAPVILQWAFSPMKVANRLKVVILRWVFSLMKVVNRLEV